MQLNEQAQMQRGFFIDLTPPGDDIWYMENKDWLVHFPKSFRRGVKRSKILQTAVVYAMGAVADCLSGGKIPRKAAVVAYLPTVEALEPYFAQGGTIATLVGAVFDHTKLFNPDIGEAATDEELDEDYEATPKCRNDLEFEFVRRHRVDDAAPEKETEKPLP